MDNYFGDLAAYCHPELAMKVIQALKASAFGEVFRKALLDGGVTNRDLAFYIIGERAGYQVAQTEFDSIAVKILKQEDVLAILNKPSQASRG
jgi:hypothetical protein